MAIVQNLEELSLPYGLRLIKTKASAPGYVDSEFSSVIEYMSAPRISIAAGVVSVRNIYEGLTGIKLYLDGTLLATVVPVAGEPTLTIDLADYQIADGRHEFYVAADGEGIEENQSNVVAYYIGVAPVYGVEWVNDATTTMTRTDEAAGMSFAIQSSDGSIASDFNDVFPWNEAAVETVDGNTMLHMPEMHFRVKTDSDGNLSGVAVSKTPSGEGDWYRVAPFYYGCYGASTDGTVLKSVTGVGRYNGATRATFRQRAAARGLGYQQLDLYHKMVMTFLWWIEWATKNSDSIMTGKTSATGASSLSTGGTDGVATPSGFNPTTKQMRYHFIEDFVGNFLEWIDGVTFNNAAYATADPSQFSDSTSTMNKLAIRRDVSGDCCAAVGWDAENPFLCYGSKTVSNSSYNTHFCDGWYISDSTNPCVCSGADWYYSAANCGLLQFGRNAAAGVYSNVGGRLLYKP